MLTRGARLPKLVTLEHDSVTWKRSLSLSGSFHTLILAKGVEGLADRAPGVFEGSGAGLSHQVLKFGEDLFDRVEIGAIGRQEQQVRASGSNGRARRLSLVAAPIVA